MAEPQEYAHEETIVDVQSYEPERKEDMSTVKDIVWGMQIDPNTAAAQMESGRRYGGSRKKSCPLAVPRLRYTLLPVI